MTQEAAADIDRQAQEMTVRFLEKIPDVRALLATDLQAFYDGDPAATSLDEIIIAYPGLLAITVNRLAHELFLLKVPLIPRIMTEYAHGRQSLRGHRRHPTIGDRVTIYSGASVLGGDTVIGHDAVIGGNAFITHSIAPGMRVSVKNQELEMRMMKDVNW